MDKSNTTKGKDIVSRVMESWNDMRTHIQNVKANSGGQYIGFGAYSIGLGALELNGDTVIVMVSNIGVSMARIRQEDPDVYIEWNCTEACDQFNRLVNLYNHEPRRFALKYYPFAVTISGLPDGKENPDIEKRLHDGFTERGFKHIHERYEKPDSAVLVDGQYEVPQVIVNGKVLPDPWGRPHTDKSRSSSPEGSSGA